MKTDVEDSNTWMDLTVSRPIPTCDEIYSAGGHSINTGKFAGILCRNYTYIGLVGLHYIVGL